MFGKKKGTTTSIHVHTAHEVDLIDAATRIIKELASRRDVETRQVALEMVGGYLCDAGANYQAVTIWAEAGEQIIAATKARHPIAVVAVRAEDMPTLMYKLKELDDRIAAEKEAGIEHGIVTDDGVILH